MTHPNPDLHARDSITSDTSPCPTCQNGRTRETTGMVCQTCGRDYAPRAAYQPPIDIVDFGAALPPRQPGHELHRLELDGYTLLAGMRDGQPFILASDSTKEQVLTALQEIVDALEADA